MTPRWLTPSRRISPRWNPVPNVDRDVSETAKASASFSRRVSQLSEKARRVAPHTSAA